MSCVAPLVGVKNIYLMYADEVTINVTDHVLLSVTFAASSKSYLVEGYKQNIQVNSALKTTDVSARIDSSVTFKVSSNDTYRERLNTVTLGKFYVLVEYNSGDTEFIGSTTPLECSSVEFDSNAGAKMYTVTLSSPEGSAGNTLVSVTSGAKNTIVSKTV